MSQNPPRMRPRIDDINRPFWTAGADGDSPRGDAEGDATPGTRTGGGERGLGDGWSSPRASTDPLLPA